MVKQSFGGNWTTKKLLCLGKYLSAYTTIMSKQKFKDYIYIDAFAGTGWFILKQNEEQGEEEQETVQLSLLSTLHSELEKSDNQQLQKKIRWFCAYCA